MTKRAEGGKPFVAFGIAGRASWRGEAVGTGGLE